MDKHNLTKPVKKKTSLEDVKKIVLGYAKKGLTKSEIGIKLRDEHNIYLKGDYGISISSILKENKISEKIPEDLMALMKKAVALIKHMDKNKKDMSAKRGYILTVSKIRRLGRYYVRKGVLPKNWKYSAEQAVLLVR